MMDGETLQQKAIHKGRENSKLEGLQRQECGGECVWNFSEQIQGTTGIMEQRAKVIRDIFGMHGVA